jgi:ParB family chromosome partitioning protein
LNDEAAFDMMISENLQRQDILPSEEGDAFKSILDKGKDIRYISERFGKSETFIHSRLSLVRLTPEIRRLLNTEEITIGMAVEISRLEPAIQEHLLKEHLETEIAFNNWKNLPLKGFKEKLEAAYTVLLSRFSFDKSECEQCTCNSEFYSLFPVLENSRCTRSVCLAKKQENYIFDRIVSAVSDGNVDVYLNNGGSIHTDILNRLGELGIEVKSGHVYPMPETPVMPAEEDFAGNPNGFKQAQKDFEAKQAKCKAFQDGIENGAVRKVILIESFEPVYGFIMLPQEKEKVRENGDTCDSTDISEGNQTVPSAVGGNSGNTGGAQSRPLSAVNNTKVEIKPDLMTTLEEKDRRNREEALCNVIEDTKILIRECDIPLSEITPFEDALLNYILLPYLNVRHNELFGISEERKMTVEERFEVYSVMTDEQKNVLKRDVVIHVMSQTSGVSKKSALLVELVKYHFPDEMASIEHTHNEEYQKKREVIREQMDKINAKNEDLQEVA